MWKKKLADMLTITRLLLALGMIRVALMQPLTGLAKVGKMLLAAWTTDFLDGPLARSSKDEHHTWIGDHDLQIDLLTGLALLVYLTAAGYIDTLYTAVYVLAWAIAFWRLQGTPKAFGALFQAPIYILFFATAAREMPELAIQLVIWVVFTNLITIKRFTEKSLPEFLGCLKKYLHPRT